MGRGTSSTQSEENNKIITHLHHLIRSAGLSNYLLRVDFIAVLFLMRRFEEELNSQKDNYIGKVFYDDNDKFRFSRFTEIGDSEELQNFINNQAIPFYRKLTSIVRYPSNKKPSPYELNFYKYIETFFREASIQKLKSGRLFEIISYVANIERESILSDDFLGDIIESAFEHQGGAERKELGLHRTPKHIRELMVELLNPKVHHRIYDPACGTAGFLISAKNYIQKKTKLTELPIAEYQKFYFEGLGGCEQDIFIHRFAMVVALTHGMNPLAIKEGDSLGIFEYARDRESYDMIITNPPFGGKKNQDHYTNLWTLNPSETTVLFLKLMYELLKMDGVCATIVSEGMNTWDDGPSIEMRRILIEDCNLLAVISLPQGVFQSPKGGVGPKTSIYVFIKGGKTEKVWFYQITNDGFAMGTKRKPIEGSQIPDLVHKWNKGRLEGENCYLIPKSKIVESGIYNLNIGNYLSGLSKHTVESYVTQSSKLKEKYANNARIVKFLKVVQSMDWRFKDNVEIIDKEAREVLQEELPKEIKDLLENMLQRGHKYPLVKLHKLIIRNDNKIKPLDFPDTKFTVLGVSNSNGVFLNEELMGKQIKQSYYRVDKNQFCYNPYRINVGSIGLNDFDIENQIISGAYNVFGCNDDIDPKYLLEIFKTKKFNEFVNSKAHGGVRMDFKIDYMEDFEIPLPPKEWQREIVKNIERQKQIIEGAGKIIKAERESRGVVFTRLENKTVPLSQLVETQYGYTDSAHDKGEFRFVRITDIDDDGRLKEGDKVYVGIVNKKDIDLYKIKDGDLLLVRTGATFGKVLLFESDEPSIFASYLIRLIPKADSFLPKYLWYFTFSDLYWQQARSLVGGGTQPQFNANKIVQIKIPLPPISIQKQIVEKLDKQMHALQGVRILSNEAERKINEILIESWGEGESLKK